jgi:hypothetical protein
MNEYEVALRDGTKFTITCFIQDIDRIIYLIGNEEVEYVEEL